MKLSSVLAATLLTFGLGLSTSAMAKNSSVFLNCRSDHPSLYVGSPVLIEVTPEKIDIFQIGNDGVRSRNSSRTLSRIISSNDDTPEVYNYSYELTWVANATSDIMDHLVISTELEENLVLNGNYIDTKSNPIGLTFQTSFSRSGPGLSNKVRKPIESVYSCE